VLWLKKRVTELIICSAWIAIGINIGLLFFARMTGSVELAVLSVVNILLLGVVGIKIPD
jgi:hypothetical protein|tara:strand:- start:25 stop:201 length:177 start_codon:yes stop_codon:yes gene_type:complete